MPRLPSAKDGITSEEAPRNASASRTGAGVWVLFYCRALLACADSLSFPFFAVYLSVERGVPMSYTGAYLSVCTLFAAFARGFGGELSDMFGRKKMMRLSVAAGAALTLLMALVIQLKLHFAWLMGLHAIGALFAAFYGPAAQAWIADNSPKKQLAQHYGIIRIGENIGWVVGPALGGLLVEKYYALLFSVTAVMYAIALAVISLRVREISPSSIRRHLQLKDMLAELRHPKFARLCALAFMMRAVMSQIVVGLSLYCVKFLGYPARSVGVLLSVNAAVVVILQYFVGRGVKDFRISDTLTVGAMLYAVGYLTIGFSHIFIWTLIGVVIFTLGEMVVSPGMQSLGANIAPPGKTGRYLGIHGLAQQGGTSMGILLGGTNMEQLAPIWREGPWVLIAFLATATAIGFHGLRKQMTPDEDGI